MKTLEEIEKMIYEMRQTLHTIINEKNNLLDPEVIAVSQELDATLNEYNNLINKQLVKQREV